MYLFIPGERVLEGEFCRAIREDLVWELYSIVGIKLGYRFPITKLSSVICQIGEYDIHARRRIHALSLEKLPDQRLGRNPRWYPFWMIEVEVPYYQLIHRLLIEHIAIQSLSCYINAFNLDVVQVEIVGFHERSFATFVHLLHIIYQRYTIRKYPNSC